MTPEPAIRDALLAAVPSLRAFAISLCGQVDRADDLVQDTLLRAVQDGLRRLYSTTWALSAVICVASDPG